jgi:hypothetical protein
MLSEDQLVALHKKCWRNWRQLQGAKICACFFCLKRFPPSQVVKWTDKTETALCPFCAVDSVLGFDVEPDESLLRQMHERWFSKTVRLTPEQWQDAIRNNAWPTKLGDCSKGTQ